MLLLNRRAGSSGSANIDADCRTKFEEESFPGSFCLVRKMPIAYFAYCEANKSFIPFGDATIPSRKDLPTRASDVT